jgi:hypothetical protein
LKDNAPVHIIDTRAQADALILGALEELQGKRYRGYILCVWLGADNMRG